MWICYGCFCVVKPISTGKIFIATGMLLLRVFIINDISDCINLLLYKQAKYTIPQMLREFMKYLLPGYRGKELPISFSTLKIKYLNV